MGSKIRDLVTTTLRGISGRPGGARARENPLEGPTEDFRPSRYGTRSDRRALGPLPDLSGGQEPGDC